MDSGFLVIIIIVVLVAIFALIQSSQKSKKDELTNTKRPNKAKKPSTILENDKMILVKNVKFEYAKQAVEQFCNVYNQDEYLALPRMYRLENEFVFTFPYDIDFERFCYFINYLKFPNEICLKEDYKPNIKAWCSTKTGDAWIPKKIENRNIMLYIPDEENEYFAVYLTSEENFCYKVDIFSSNNAEQIDRPILKYETKPIDNSSLSMKEIIDFE